MTFEPSPESILTFHARLRQVMSLASFWRCYMLFWRGQQEGLCRDHCPDLGPDDLRVLFGAYPRLRFLSEPLVNGAVMHTALGIYRDEEILWPEYGHRN